MAAFSRVAGLCRTLATPVYTHSAAARFTGCAQIQMRSFSGMINVRPNLSPMWIQSPVQVMTGVNRGLNWPQFYSKNNAVLRRFLATETGDMEGELMKQKADRTAQLVALIKKLEQDGSIDTQSLKEKVDVLAGDSGPKLANPAAVGLCAFGLDTLLLQFHNLGLMAGVGPVVWSGLVFGGVVQMIAGFQEYQNGNNFGYCAFTAYGAFWIALCLMWLGDHQGVFKTTSSEKACFFAVYTLYTALMTFGAAKISLGLFTTFAQLTVGFLALDAHLLYPEEKSYQTAAGVVLTGTALNALYCMMNIVMTSVFKRPMFPVGKPIL